MDARRPQSNPSSKANKYSARSVNGVPPGANAFGPIAAGTPPPVGVVNPAACETHVAPVYSRSLLRKSPRQTQATHFVPPPSASAHHVHAPRKALHRVEPKPYASAGSEKTTRQSAPATMAENRNGEAPSSPVAAGPQRTAYTPLPDSD